MKTITKELQAGLTPKDAHKILVEGNHRFVKNLKAQRNLKQQVFETSNGQFPFAVILSCIDSRVPVELIFDQGIGDVFSVRIAGNIINKDILGSMEYACNVVGAKILMVLGHTNCGAITAACNKVELGNLTPLLNKIKISRNVDGVEATTFKKESIDKVSLQNIQNSIHRIRKESKILNRMEEEGAIEIVGAMYSVLTGNVHFL